MRRNSRDNGHRPCPDCGGPLYGREGDCGNEECPYHHKVVARMQANKERAARFRDLWRTEWERLRWKVYAEEGRKP